jgi:hypothetical protein
MDNVELAVVFESLTSLSVTSLLSTRMVSTQESFCGILDAAQVDLPQVPSTELIATQPQVCMRRVLATSSVMRVKRMIAAWLGVETQDAQDAEETAIPS